MSPPPAAPVLGAAVRPPIGPWAGKTAGGLFGPWEGQLPRAETHSPALTSTKCRPQWTDGPTAARHTWSTGIVCLADIPKSDAPLHGSASNSLRAIPWLGAPLAKIHRLRAKIAVSLAQLFGQGRFAAFVGHLLPDGGQLFAKLEDAALDIASGHKITRRSTARRQAPTAKLA